MANLVALPLLLPLLAAIAAAMLTGRMQRALSVAGGAATLAAATAVLLAVRDGTILVLRLGGWGPRAGIVWVADRTSALMLVAAAVVALAVLLCAPSGWREEPPPRGLQPLLQLLALGVNGALLTGDFFNLFVFYEVTLVASFGLLVMGEGRDALRRALPYVVINLVSSLLLLAAVGAVYALAGTVNMAELSLRLARAPPSTPLWLAVGLMLAVFAVKAGIVPFFVWLPDSYPAAPLTITALFAGLLTKVGVYTLFRAAPLLAPAPNALYPALVVLGAVTMLVGVFGALGRSTVRGILSFHIVSQVGYMVFGLGLGTSAGLAAALLFTLHNMLVKPALVLAGGVAERLGPSGELADLGGLARAPWAAAAFFVPAMALAGLPPLSGFWGKVLLLRAGFAGGAWGATFVALGVSLLTLASMLKIWSAVYWSGAADAPTPRLGAAEWRLVASALGLASLAVAMGLAIGPLYRFADAAARQLLEVQPYLQAVLGGAP